MPPNQEDLLKAGLANARIEHLSKEIETATKNLMIFRTRIGFTFLVGPFFVMGSVLIATKGEIEPPVWDRELVFFAIVAAVAYMASAAWGANYDRGCQEQCNTWREAIVALQKKPNAEPEINTKVSARRAYLSGFFLVLILFSALIYCLPHFLPAGE